MTFKSGVEYQGQWKNGKIDGAGFISVNNQKIEGRWIETDNRGEIARNNAQSTGITTIVYANGDTFVGMLQNSLPSGNGTVTYKAGDSENGTWIISGDQSCLGSMNEAGLPNGQATCVDSVGNRYRGGYSEGKISGQGTFFHNSGVDTGKWKVYGEGVYFGNWREGKPSGDGVMVYNDGERWTGTWKQGDWNEGYYYSKTGELIQSGLWEEGKCLKKN